MSLTFTGPGIFATARRGGVDASEVYRLQRKFPRAGAQTLATMLGAPLTSVQALMFRPVTPSADAPKPALAPVPAPISHLPQCVDEPWPFNPAPEAVEKVVRRFAESRDLLLRELVRPGRGPHRMAERAMFAAVRELTNLSWERMADVFNKDRNSLIRDVKDYYRRITAVAA